MDPISSSTPYSAPIPLPKDPVTEPVQKPLSEPAGATGIENQPPANSVPGADFLA